MRTYPWLRLLSPVPGDEGECRRGPLSDSPGDGWEQIRVVLGNKRMGMRIVSAHYTPEGRPTIVHDVVMTQGGYLQESARAGIDQQGRVTGMHWRSQGKDHQPRALTPEEERACRELADSLRARAAAAAS